MEAPEEDPRQAFWNQFSSYYSETIEGYTLDLGLSLSRMLRLDSAKNIVEIGCGSGNLTLYWLQHLPAGVKYTSIDFSSEMIKTAEKKKEKLKNRLNEIEHSFITHDAQDLSFLPDESAEVFIAPLCVHAVADGSKALREAVRVLKKGGRIGFTVLGPQAKDLVYEVLNNRFLEFGITMFHGRSIHHLGDRDKLIKLAEEAGVKVDYCWDQDVIIDAFDEEEFMKNVFEPEYLELLHKQEKDVQTKLIEGLKKDFEEMKNKFIPLKINVLFLVGTKP